MTPPRARCPECAQWIPCVRYGRASLRIDDHWTSGSGPCLGSGRKLVPVETPPRLRVVAAIAVAVMFWTLFTVWLVQTYKPTPARCPNWLETHWGRCP
jgi:hypothetical protein